jgi:glycosyltransferase involved in cell wall biosynthesis
MKVSKKSNIKVSKKRSSSISRMRRGSSKRSDKKIDRSIKVMDWLVHGGHQYEFFKTGPMFFCSAKDGGKPTPESLGRPANKNVLYLPEKNARVNKFDILMVRSGISKERVEAFKSLNKIIPAIAVVQTHTPFKIPRWVRCIVWNSKWVMDEYRKQFPRQRHFYIPHGFDPNEFVRIDSIQRNERILSASSVFEERGHLLGFKEWKWVSEQSERCDLLGHGNDSLSESIGCHPLEGLVRTYNEYAVFLNTTTRSAMPRARAEALMCGTPMVTTNNFGIDRYLKHGVNCFFADNKTDMLKYCNKILYSKDLQEELGFAGRERAKKCFHINDYIERWQAVFKEALR